MAWRSCAYLRQRMTRCLSSNDLRYAPFHQPLRSTSSSDSYHPTIEGIAAAACKQAYGLVTTVLTSGTTRPSPWTQAKGLLHAIPAIISK